MHPEQANMSRRILEESQKISFPYSVTEMGLEIIVDRGVFSPKYFHGWRIFTRNFPYFKGEDILEIGCGTGVTSIFLAKNGANKVLACDINKAAVINTAKNTQANNLGNIEVIQSDIFSAILPGSAFDTIYWNMPFILQSSDYEYESDLERALFDPGYRLLDSLLGSARSFLKSYGRLLIGFGDFGSEAHFDHLVRKHGYSCKLRAQELSTEGSEVRFQLYELHDTQHRNLQIAVFGSDGDHASTESLDAAYNVGREIAMQNHILLTGGGTGVMAAVSRGAYEHGGIVVGITPGTQKAQCNEFSTVRLPTGFGFARSQILAHSADGAILIEGGIGTQEEAGRMYWEKKPTVALVPSGGIAAQIAGKYLDKRELMVISPAYSAEESVHTLVQCIRKIQHNLD